MGIITPLQAIRKAIDNGEDVWEAIVTLAMTDNQNMDEKRWEIGDLGILVRAKYGRNRLGSFATAAGIARSTASQYRTLAKFYDEDCRYVYDNISYSHFRHAMSLKDDALDFLEECSANGWTPEECQIRVKERLGKPLPPLKILDAEGCLESIDYATGKLVLMVAPGADLALLEGYLQRDVRVKIYQMEGEG